MGARTDLTRLFQAAAVCLLGPMAAAAAASPDVAADSAAPVITVVAARRGAIAETVTLVGSLTPREEVLVNPQIDGLAVTGILVEEGDKVVAGQILARLTRDALDAQLAQNTAQLARAAAAIAQAQGNIVEAQANKVQAEASFNRSRELVGSGTMSRETYDQRLAASQAGAARLTAAQNALGVAQADQALTEAQRQELLVRIGRTDIRAPVAGTVSRRTARLGAVVSAAGDPLFRIIADSAVELEGEVPEALLNRLRAGQPASVTVPGRPAVPGQVRLVSPEVDRGTRLGRVRVRIDTGQPLAIGGFARAVVEVAREDGVLLPASAVLAGTDGARVQVVRDGRVETRPVTIGLRSSTQAEITQGVADGEQAVAVSGTFVRDGDRVTVAPAPVTATPVAVR